MPIEAVWPSILSSKIPNSVVYNLAQGGFSGDYVVRSIYKTIDILKPNLVAVFWPPRHRYETLESSNTALQKASPKGPGSHDFSSLYLDDDYEFYQFQKNKALLTAFCENKAPVIQLSYEEVTGPNRTILPAKECYTNRARDNGHLGIEWQNDLADEFYKQYLNLVK